MKSLIKIIALIIPVMMSCNKLPDESLGGLRLGNGIFIVNEGQYTAGNGSVSFYSYDSSKVFNDLFTTTNSRPLGDVPNSMTVFGGNAYIVVNNSGKIEVVNNSTMVSEALIPGLVSPRNLAVINNQKAYVTSMYSKEVAIIDLLLNSVTGHIDIGQSTEAIAVAGQYAYTSNWIGGDKVFVINTSNDAVVDSITVDLEPESMVVDKNNNLWVLCGGGWQRENFAKLIMINTTSNTVVKTFTFPSLQNYPSCLRIDGAGQTLYFLDRGVYKMDINSSGLPGSSYIAEGESLFYELAVNPLNGDILVTDAGDYVHNGYLMMYKNDGSFISKHEVGITPGSLSFRLVD